MAFDAPTLEDLEVRKQRWREHGLTVTEIDWGNTLSIYTVDPNGILVEFACTTAAFFTTEERIDAPANLEAQRPELEKRPEVKLYAPERMRGAIVGSGAVTDKRCDRVMEELPRRQAGPLDLAEAPATKVATTLWLRRLGSVDQERLVARSSSASMRSAVAKPSVNVW